MSALLAAALALAGPPAPVSVEAPHLRVAAGGTAEARVIVRIRPGFHVQANPAAEEFLVPLTVELLERPPVRVGLPVYPAGQPHRLRGATRDLLTYEGEVTVRVPLSAESDGERGPDDVIALSGCLRYQACNDRVCLRPSTAPLRLIVRVRGSTSGVRAERMPLAGQPRSSCEQARVSRLPQAFSSRARSPGLEGPP